VPATLIRRFGVRACRLRAFAEALPGDFFVMIPV